MKLTAPVLACSMVMAALAVQALPLHPRLFAAPLLFFALARSRFRNASGPVLVFGVCLILAAWRLHPPGNDLGRLLPRRAHALDLRVEIAGDAVNEDERVRVPVRIRAVRYRPEWERVTARAQLRFEGVSPEGFLPGTRWRVHGRVEPRSLSFTGLRRAEWLIQADPSTLEPGAGGSGGGLRRFFHGMRDTLSSRLALAARGDPEVADVLQALLLARRGDVDDAWTRRFARTGMIHLFAISGLHLGLLASFLLLAARAVRVPYRWRGLLILPVLFAFTASTGFRASALRALVMSACLVCAPMVYRRPSPVAAFCLAVTLILGWAPEQLFDIGFQYSFLLVGGLLAFASRFDSSLLDVLRGDPWAPPETRWPWWKRHLARPALSLAMVTLLCFVLSAPLTAHTFHLFSPVGVIGNLFAVPLAFLLLATGFPALFALALPPEFAAAFLWPARLAARGLLDGVNLLDQLPVGVWWVRGPALWQLALFYGLPVLAWRLPRHRSLLLVIALLAVGFSAARFSQNLRRAEAVVVDADRGQAAWLRNGARGALLIDAGSAWSGWDVREALQSGGVNRIPALFLTHPSRYHVRGLEHILESHPPERVYVAAPDADHPAYAELDSIALRAGDRFELAGWEVEVLWPPEGWDARAAGMRSLVLRFSDGFASLLVMGGADERVEAELIARGDTLPARLLYAGNVTRAPGASEGFLREVRPEALVFSGRGFRGVTEGRERSESRAMRLGLPVWRVPENGRLRFDLRAGTVLE